MQFLENAKTFSVHETGFEHKIYGWLCFCQYERSGKWGRIKFTTAEHRCHYIFPSSGWFVVGRIKKEFKIVLFLSVVGNRDVWCVACLFAKLVVFFFWFHLRRRQWRHCYVNGSDGIDPLVVEQALLECFKALWSAEFSVIWRLGGANKWTFCLESKSIIMCWRMKLSEEQLIVKFFLL